MNNVLTYAFIFCAVFVRIHGYTMVVGQTDTCDNTQAVTENVFSKAKSSVIQSGKLDFTVACSMDLCRIPTDGSIASGNVWGIDADQTDGTTLKRSMNYNKMTRLDCDALRGDYTGNPSSNQEVNCGLFWIELDGTDRDNLVSLILGSPGSCNRISSMKIRMTQQNCVYASGTWSGNPGANDVIDCTFDVCMSPVLDCEPSDSWSTIQTCENPSSATVTSCSFSMTTGVERGQASESSSGGDVSVSITAEVSAQLGEIFSASVSTSVTTGYNWASAVSNHQIWSETSTRTIDISLDPGQAVDINQVVGECGDFTISTNRYTVVDR